MIAIEMIQIPISFSIARVVLIVPLLPSLWVEQVCLYSIALALYDYTFLFSWLSRLLRLYIIIFPLDRFDLAIFGALSQARIRHGSGHGSLLWPTHFQCNRWLQVTSPAK